MVGAAVLGIAIFAFACGSSSIARIRDVGGVSRWVMLFVLFGFSAVWALKDSRRPKVSLTVITAAFAFVALTFVSVVWSVDARLSFERAVSLAVVFATALLLAHAAAADEVAAERLLLGVVGGAAAVALAGLVILAVDHDAAVEFGGLNLPNRYQGLGENPNTVPLLLALCQPIVIWLLIRLRSRAGRSAVALLGLFFVGSIVASGSRGALIAGFVGSLIVVAIAPMRWRAQAIAATGLCVLFAVSIVVALTPRSLGHEHALPPAPAPASSSAPSAHPRYVNVQGPYPMEFDIGSEPPGKLKPTPRPLFGLSGRSQAWSGALVLADKRPVVGYGFGTESRVFVDRYANFASGLPENSYLGIYLQLGIIGVAAFAVLVLALIASAARSHRRWNAAAPLGVLVAGLMLAVVQSFIYSVGNIATLTLWVCAFLAGTALRREPVRR